MSRTTLEPAIASCILECRRVLAKTWGQNYNEKISEYKSILAGIRDQTREPVLLAAQRLIKALGRDLHSGIQQVAFLAAAQELMEEEVCAT